MLSRIIKRRLIPLVQERMSVPWSSIILASLSHLYFVVMSEGYQLSFESKLAYHIFKEGGLFIVLGLYQKFDTFRGPRCVLGSSEESGQTSFTFIGSHTKQWNN